jgi:hypothetical protein
MPELRSPTNDNCTNVSGNGQNVNTAVALPSNLVVEILSAVQPFFDSKNAATAAFSGAVENLLDIQPSRHRRIVIGR